MSDFITNKLHICPVCAQDGLEYCQGRKWKCPSCEFTLYNNVATAVGLIINFNDRGEVYKKGAKTTDKNFVLCIKRGKEPRKGWYALPGGFVDADEAAEDACIRECREETGLVVTSVQFLCSAPNSYDYKDVDYKTCDLFFEADILDTGENAFLGLSPDDKDEITDYKLFPADCEADIDKIPFAFPSAVLAVKKWLALRNTH